MRVLITGGAGFIGSHIAELLAGQGHEPVVLDALLPAAHGDGDVPEWIDENTLVRGDVRDPDVLREALRGVDVVCHQAAMVGHGVDPTDAPDYAAHNDLGTATLLAEMYRAGVTRLVLASSMVVYGEGRYRCSRHGIVSPGPRDRADIEAGRFEPPCSRCGSTLEPELVPEDAPVDPRSTYAATKLAQEHLAGAWARQSGGAVHAMRYHNVYGPRMPRDTPYSGVASIFRSALERGVAPTVLEDGAQRRDFVHVRDVAIAVALAVQAQAEPGRCTPLNVCSGQPHTVGEMAATLAECMGGPSPRIAGGARSGDVRHIVADPGRAQRELGFRAAIGFTEGMAEFATAPLRAPATRS
ncbi:NAD-dependent epimerase/dehydratase family protein [Sciscionella marina]|uniref:NAD-dependent epimerase/dehydratase family protein n=1 Tax=Sciscionella marina TaxID=508770 RepID=UPI0003671428|nr:NAD-dependent epimerase/dehydratase family protein [Sciscionella marina]